MPTFGWGQQQELSFIAGLGKHVTGPHAFTPKRPQAYALRCVGGYIQSLNTRSVWWPGVDVPALRTAAERRLLQVAGLPGNGPH